MSSQTMTVTCVISLTRIRFLTRSRTLLIMSLTILSVLCIFLLKNENEKLNILKKSIKLEVWRGCRGVKI